MVSFRNLLDYPGYQIARILAELGYFSAGFQYFPSVYHYFESRNMDIVATPMFWATGN